MKSPQRGFKMLFRDLALASLTLCQDTTCTEELKEKLIQLMKNQCSDYKEGKAGAFSFGEKVF